MLDLFRDLEAVNQHAIRTFVTRRLADRFPNRSVALTKDDAFDVESWAAHSARIAIEHPTPAAMVRSVHDEGWSLVAGHSRFTWNGHEYQVVTVSVPSPFEGDVRLSWVISDELAHFTELFAPVVAYNREVHGEVLVYSAGCFSKDRGLQTSIESTSFADLVLPKPLAASLEADLSQFLASRELYRTAGAVWKRGILLLGPPGNGKTHAIKALIRQTRLPCLYVKSFTGRHTDPADSIPRAFARARELSPCVVVLEDLDSLVDDDNRSFLLNELDGFANNDGIITIASSNHPERLDPSLLHRPSRFDRKYRFELPSLELRRAYLDRWARSVRGGVGELALAQAAAESDGFTFAYLKELTLSTQMQWVSDGAVRAIGEVLVQVLGGLKEEISAVSREPEQPPRPKAPRFPYPYM